MFFCRRANAARIFSTEQYTQTSIYAFMNHPDGSHIRSSMIMQLRQS